MRKKKNDLRADPAVEVDDLRVKAVVGARLADLADQEGSIVVADDRPVPHQLRAPIVIVVVIVIAVVIVIVIAAVIGEADAMVAPATSETIGAAVVAIAAAVAAREEPAEARVHADDVAADEVPVAAARVARDRRAVASTTTSTTSTIERKGP